jgi:hypothetical protein
VGVPHFGLFFFFFLLGEALGVFGLEMRMRLSTFVHFVRMSVLNRVVLCSIPLIWEEQQGSARGAAGAGVEAAGEGGGGGCIPHHRRS